MSASELLAGILWSAVVCRLDRDLLEEGWNGLADALWFVTMGAP
jgi:hypothetical protein